jgi:polysaccharide pyruvyl transferase WcaK-like protein
MKIGLLDHMGYGNLGDAATQEALIANIKVRLPDAEIIGFSLNPDDTRIRHNIVSYSITHWHPGLNKPQRTATERSNRRFELKPMLKKIPIFSALVIRVLYLVREVRHLRRCFIVLKSLDSLIIAGGGQLSELWRGPWSHPYNVFKFSLLTKLAKKKLLFLNVGAGPLTSTLGRAFIRYSITVADYVSFRDVQSQTLVYQLGVKRETHVLPDSAYSLKIPDYGSESTQEMSRPLVGLNPIGFCDPRIWPKQNVSVYLRYLENLAEFSRWILSNNYRLRIYSAEGSVDAYALKDLKERLLNSLSTMDVEQIFIPPSNSVEDLMGEMSQFDVVVTSKFHGVVMSHLLGKPVIALSYHNKIDDLMRAVGHSEYCANIESFEVEDLKKMFISLVEDAAELKGLFRNAVHSNAAMLKGQFDELFVSANPLSHRPAIDTEKHEGVGDVRISAALVSLHTRHDQ